MANTSSHTWLSLPVTLLWMNPAALAQLLSENLNWLMDQHKKALDSSAKVAAKAREKGHALSQRTAHRAITGKRDDEQPAISTTETIAALAAAFGIKPWELLHPDLPTLYAQTKLALQEQEAVRDLRERALELSPAARAQLQADLFGSEELKEVMRADPYPSAGLVRKGWSAADKAVSRKVE